MVDILRIAAEETAWVEQNADWEFLAANVLAQDFWMPGEAILGTRGVLD